MVVNSRYSGHSMNNGTSMASVLAGAQNSIERIDVVLVISIKFLNKDKIFWSGVIIFNTLSRARI